jgi:hypothetical protein
MLDPDCVRLCSDTRSPLQSEPVDDRWLGRKPKAPYAWTKGKMATMEEARQRWGV